MVENQILFFLIFLKLDKYKKTFLCCVATEQKRFTFYKPLIEVGEGKSCIQDSMDRTTGNEMVAIHLKEMVKSQMKIIAEEVKAGRYKFLSLAF